MGSGHIDPALHAFGGKTTPCLEQPWAATGSPADAWDQRGTRLPAELRWHADDGPEIVVDDRGAEYPITVDPDVGECPSGSCSDGQVSYWRFMCGAAMALLALGFEGLLSRGDGGVLLLGMIVYLYVQLTGSQAADPATDLGSRTRPSWSTALLLLPGLPLLGVSADITVDAAVSLAEAAGLSRRVIGLTVVAIGTSLPELAASLVAAWRREGDLAVANVVGSNVFNVLGIAGAMSLVLPLTVNTAMIHRDLPVMLGLTLLLGGLMARGGDLDRRHGVGLLACAVAYTAWLVAW